MSIQEIDGRSMANAGSLVPNETQDHEFSADESPESVQGEFEGKGESAERTPKVSKATLGWHVTSGKDGLEVAKQRAAHVLANRKVSEAPFHRKKK